MMKQNESAGNILESIGLAQELLVSGVKLLICSRTWLGICVRFKDFNSPADKMR